ncbi:MAG: hypothetical protein ABFD92_04530 [Planctomycetaceae bacterium]|nr:glycosyltransferase family 39 protein [Planctomycetaceae bacterium]
MNMKNRTRILHLTAIVIVGIVARLLMAWFSPVYSGMTRDYLGPAYMLACGYGYNRPPIDQWYDFRRELATYSQQVSQQGLQVDFQHRPQTDMSLLRPEYLRTPGYPVFLLAVYRVFGEPLELHVKWVQAFITAFFPLIVFAIVMKLFKRAGAAYAAAWLMAVYPPVLTASVQVLPSGMALGVLLLGVLCCIHGADKPSYIWMAASGLLIAISSYLRPGSMLVWPFLGLALLIRQRGWVRPLVSTAVLAVALYAATFPWAYRNYVTSGCWLWGSTGAGVTLWKGIGQNPNPWGIVCDDNVGTAVAKQQGFESDLTLEADAWFLKEVKAHAKENPGFFVKAALSRLPLILATPYSTGFVNSNRTQGMISHFRNKEGLTPVQTFMRYPGYVINAFWERILVMAISGLGSMAALLVIILYWDQRKSVSMLLAVPVYTVLLYTCTLYVYRYLIPLIPFQMACLALVGSAWVERRRKKAAL